eukprot:gene9888-10898_t
MPGQDPRLRQIKIKTGIIKRIAKERSMYEKEVKDHEIKAEKMKEEGKDEYDIRKQIEILNESKQMIPDCTKRLKNAYSELTQILEKEQDLAETEDYKVAKDLLQEVSV